VDDLSFTVRPGVVTGFLGPNGAGKSTTMRMILGLDRPSGGTVRVNGKEFAQHAAPLHEVGALLEARAFHTGRSARNHLRVMAATSGIGRSRVEQVIDMVGLGDVADRRVGTFSLGMGQRLGVAAAMLGDPQTLILDEPVNGLDLDGIRWIRSLLTGLAAEGRTVFLSSHLMSEMAVTADHVIVVGKGRLLKDLSMAEFIDESAVESVRVRSPRAAKLARLLRGHGATVTDEPDGALVVDGMSSDTVGTLAGRARVTLLELSPRVRSLEDAYLDLTSDTVDFRATA
jgi:ABC-2 type transport system ATP-binding protein